jgi:hypothetical protein
MTSNDPTQLTVVPQKPAPVNPVIERERLIDLIKTLGSAEIAPTVRIARQLERLRSSPLYEVGAAIAEAATQLANLSTRVLLRDIGEAMRPASHERIAIEMVELLAMVPGRDDIDLSTFTKVAVRDIADAKPTRLHLTAAFRELRLTKKFRPTVAEMLEALRAVELPAVAPLLEMRTNLDKAPKLLRERIERDAPRLAAKAAARWAALRPEQRAVWDRAAVILRSRNIINHQERE